MRSTQSPSITQSSFKDMCPPKKHPQRIHSDSRGVRGQESKGNQSLRIESPDSPTHQMLWGREEKVERPGRPWGRYFKIAVRCAASFHPLSKVISVAGQ